MVVNIMHCPRCQRRQLIQTKICGIWLEYRCTVCNMLVHRMKRKVD